MKAVFKGFDLKGDGHISLEDFDEIGHALNWAVGGKKWTGRQNKALHRQMDANSDGIVVLEEFLYFYRKVIYDLEDDRFEKGLRDFHTAVQRVYKAHGVNVDFATGERTNDPIEEEE